MAKEGERVKKSAKQRRTRRKGCFEDCAEGLRSFAAEISRGARDDQVTSWTLATVEVPEARAKPLR